MSGWRDTGYGLSQTKQIAFLCDQMIKLKGIKSLNNYPEILRRIKYFDKEQQRTFVFLTNNFLQPATILHCCINIDGKWNYSSNG